MMTLQNVKNAVNQLIEEERARMTAAMNEDYIEDVNLDQWRD